MLKPFAPRLDVLPRAQRQFWSELKAVPDDFVLYGGTALALRLGHRASADFDFFSSEPFTVDELVQRIPWVERAERLQVRPNTLTVAVDKGGPIKISFFGGLTLGRVDEPQRTEDNVLRVASLLDLTATKVAVIQQRAERKDYRDLAEALRAGVNLPEVLGAAQALYRESFNPMISLKALSYFKDGDLPALPDETKTFLSDAASRVNSIPMVQRLSDKISANR